MPLSVKKKARIKAMGGSVTTVEEWLDLTPEEVTRLHVLGATGSGKDHEHRTEFARGQREASMIPWADWGFDEGQP